VFVCNVRINGWKKKTKFYTRNLGLPDGTFACQKSQRGKILEGLGVENVGIFQWPRGMFLAIWYILWSFGIFPFW
jgi:hypothetical protein